MGGREAGARVETKEAGRTRKAAPPEPAAFLTQYDESGAQHGSFGSILD